MKHHLFHKLPQADQSILDAMWGQHPLVFSTLEGILREVCKEGLDNSLQVLLDNGVSPNGLKDQKIFVHPGFSESDVFPLGRVGDKNTIEMVDMLISHGADPNYGYTMHQASYNPVAMACLIEHGCNPNQVCQGKSVLDHWLGTAHGAASPKAKKRCLKSFEILIAGGVDLSQPMEDGRTFLVACWADPFLRQHIPFFIDKGADPFLRGTCKGSQGLNLEEHLAHKLSKVKSGGNFTAQTLAFIQARKLESQTDVPAGTGSRPRI